MKISPGGIHITDDITNVAHNSSKHKDPKKKHASREDVLLQVVKEKVSVTVRQFISTTEMLPIIGSYLLYLSEDLEFHQSS